MYRSIYTKTVVLIVMLLFVCHFKGQGQQLVPCNNVQIQQEEITLSNPFTGGFLLTRYNNFDVNNDGIEDLLIYDAASNIYIPYLWNDTIAGNWAYTPEYASMFPPTQHFVLFSDFNCDGLKDIFTTEGDNAAEVRLKMYKTELTADSTYSFTAVNYQLTGTSDTSILLNAFDLPGIADINNDGDLDLVYFPRNVNYISYLENQSMELGIGCDSLIFDLAEECWGSVEFTLSDELTLDSDCSLMRQLPCEGCAGASLLPLDTDNDGDKDLLFSNIYGKHIAHLTNNGTADFAIFIEQNKSYLLDDPLMDYPAPYWVDANNDQVKDLIVSCNRLATYDGTLNTNYLLFNNEGSDSLPNFQPLTNRFLTDQTINLGFNSAPVFFDANADGLQDLIVIANTKHPFYSYTSNVFYYENTGSLESAVFRLVSTNFANLNAYNWKNIKLSFGDIDNDGDQDMILGHYLGNLHVFINDGGVGSDTEWLLNSDLFSDIDLGTNASPHLVDLDLDSRLDVVVGNNSGQLFYFESTSASPTDLSFELVNDNLGTLSFEESFNINISPFFYFIDSIGDYNLLIGKRDGTISKYGNIIENIYGGSFDLQTHFYQNIDVGTNAVIYLDDINNDNAHEAIIGNERGGLRLFTSLIDTDTLETYINNIVQIKNNVSFVQQNDQLTINFTDNISTINKCTVAIYSINGQLMWREKLNLIQQNTPIIITINTSTWQQQLYLCKLTIDGKNIIKKFTTY